MPSAADTKVAVFAKLQKQRRSLRRELAKVERALATTQEEVDQLKDRLYDQAQTETHAA